MMFDDVDSDVVDDDDDDDDDLDGMMLSMMKIPEVEALLPTTYFT